MNVTMFPEQWQEKWQQEGFKEPTDIQKELWEPLREGKSVLGVSPTGSGKTLAYLLPLMTQIKAGEGNQLLILLPTQELAMQITEVARAWLTGLTLNVQPIIGQANIKRQIEKLKEKPEIIVGTPGRVYELVQQKKIKAHLLKTFVLDEVDQLLAHSELNAARNIIQRLDKDIQMVGISATGNHNVEAFTQLVRKDVTAIDVTGEVQPNQQVQHGYIATPARKRAAVLRSLAYVEGMRAIVFFNEVQDLGSVAEKLAYDGIPNATLASDQNKFERQAAIHAFQEGKVPFLLTTDLGARGLDFKEVAYVIHYDVPYEKETYVHRSGRTGRMGQAGTVLTLLADNQLKDLKKVSQDLSSDLVEMFLHASQLTLEKPKVSASKKVKPKTSGAKKKNKKKKG